MMLGCAGAAYLWAKKPVKRDNQPAFMQELTTSDSMANVYEHSETKPILPCCEWCLPETHLKVAQQVLKHTHLLRGAQEC